MVQKIPNSMLEELAPDVVGLVPVGAVIDYFGAVAPANWLLCHGQSVSKTDYPALWAAVGTTFGSTSTHFTLPDYRGRVSAGKDNMGGTPANRLTSTSGMTGSTLGAAGGDQRMQSHNHSITDPGHSHNMVGAASSSGDMGPGFGGVEINPSAATLSAYTGITVNSTGAGNAQNVQPTIIANKIIRAK